ncbi:hypothetical protein KCP76_09680 [Salmonella enterica subsp. enterica serovar Weltevreden]|nr:hypothetical protein KCP76_09680 [Salmonella enterica subsp. enterica serovar Weltevreden]
MQRHCESYVPLSQIRCRRDLSMSAFFALQQQARQVPVQRFLRRCTCQMGGASTRKKTGNKVNYQ